MKVCESTSMGLVRGGGCGAPRSDLHADGQARSKYGWLFN